MATFYFSYMHAHTHIHTFSLLGGLRVNVEGDPRVTSPGQVLPGNSAINKDYGAPLETHEGSQTSKTQSLGKSHKHRKALGTPPCENATQNQGRLFQVNQSRI